MMRDALQREIGKAAQIAAGKRGEQNTFRAEGEGLSSVLEIGAGAGTELAVGAGRGRAIRDDGRAGHLRNHDDVHLYILAPLVMREVAPLVDLIVLEDVRTFGPLGFFDHVPDDAGLKMKSVEGSQLGLTAHRIDAGVKKV